MPLTQIHPNAITLATIANGAAEELFATEVMRVLDNVVDLNTDHKQTRTITLTVSITPNELRDEAAIAVKCVSKLAGLKKLSSHVYVARHRGHLVAVEHNPKQAGLFEENPKPALVANWPGASKPEAARD